MSDNIPTQSPRSELVTYRELELKLSQAKRDNEEMLKLELQKLRKQILDESFPDGDGVKHKDYHLDTMDAVADRKALLKDMRNNAAKAILWFFLALLGSAVWEYIKREAQK